MAGDHGISYAPDHQGGWLDVPAYPHSQGKRWEAWQDKEKIHIQSCDKTRARFQKILIDTSKDREKIHIWGLNNGQEILIDGTAGQEKVRLTDKAGQEIIMNALPGGERIQLTDKSGSSVLMDGVSGNIIIRSTNKVLINP